MSTIADLAAEINAQLATNNTGKITAATLRTVLTDLLTFSTSDAIQAYLNALPTTLPVTAGVWWNNGNTISRS